MASQQQLANQAANAVGRLWRQVDSLDDAAQDRFARQAARVVGGAQSASVRSTQSFLATAERNATGSPGEPLANPSAVLADYRNGTPLVEVYARPMVTARTAVSLDVDFRTALQYGWLRATSTADTDVILAQNLAAREYMQRSSRIVGYQRVPDAGACLLCLSASTQRYKRDDLQPIHERCHCGVIPIIGSKDPGHVINPELLKQIKDGPKVAIKEHGELGPVLTKAVDAFTGPKGIS